MRGLIMHPRNNIILLAGPGKPAFEKKDVLLAEKALMTQGANVVRIGDGEHNILSADIDRLLESIKSSDSDVTLVIMAHGDERGYLDLTGEFTTSAEELFRKVTDSSGGHKIDVFSIACYGGVLAGSALREGSALRALPKGSAYISLSPKKTGITGENIEPFWAYLAEHNLSCSSAESMLVVYLVVGMKNRYVPTISTQKTTVDLERQLAYFCGKLLSKEIRAAVCSDLSPLIDPIITNTLMNEIEKARFAGDFSAAKYGPLLAICHAASGKMELYIKPTEIKTTNEDAVPPKKQLNPVTDSKDSLFNNTINPLDNCLMLLKQACSSTQKGGEIQEAIDNRSYSQAFRKACAYGAVEVVNIFLQNKSLLNFDINEPSSNGKTALDWAKNADIDNKIKEPLVKQLITAGAMTGVKKTVNPKKS